MVHLKYMALRVLLADESSTIKKVIQLALQDFGVEVKAVPVGIDVEAVTRQFKPDIILADVLLVKKNGYELAMEFKQNPELKSIPIVLMWSGFIAFDHDKFIQSQADDKLEKPFDAETLRQIILKHVPKLQTNKIAPFLSYDLPDFVETPPRITIENHSLPKIELPVTSKPTDSGQKLDPSSPGTSRIFDPPKLPPSHDLPELSKTSPISNLEVFQVDKSPLQAQPIEIPKTDPLPSDDLDDIDDFQQVPLPSKRKSKPSTEEWSLKKTISVGQDPILPKSVSIPDPFSIDVSDAQIATMGQDELAIHLSDIETFEKKPSLEGIKSKQQSEQTPLVKSLPQNIDPVRLEELIRDQVREVLKEIAWRIVPDVAERVVREEMQNLLKEAERLP